jgi:hypothetical protein
LAVFWGVIASAGIILRASNPELGSRVGLSGSFFSSVTRERRRPKLTSFLRALESVIEVADERLAQVGDVAGESRQPMAGELSPLLRHRDELFVLATSLAQLARSEIERIDGERPNDEETIARNKQCQNLLSILANGFDRIATELAALSADSTQPSLVTRAGKVVRTVGRELGLWWRENGSEAIDWSMRIPLFAAGVAVLNLAGAEMTVGTSTVAAIVGGEKVAKVIAAKRAAR